MQTDSPILLQKEQQAQAVETLVAAFQDDVLKRTLAPNLKNRAPLTRWVFKGVVRYCLAYGEVHITPGAAGVACWLPPGKTEMSSWGSLVSWDLFPGPFWMAGWRTARRFLHMQDVVEKYHKQLMPREHWYLWALAVRPGSQGQGLGSRLMKPMMERADREGAPCYLETQTAQNVTFYSRRGFQVAHSEEIMGLKLWFMVREPQS